VELPLRIGLAAQVAHHVHDVLKALLPRAGGGTESSSGLCFGHLRELLSRVAEPDARRQV
jgi:hypothetical protein